MRMILKIYTVDAFTAAPFAGNPAAVVPHLEPIEEKTLQKVAAELNLSETAYVSPATGAVGESNPFKTCSLFRLRWFTPTNEVALCGHATLATAHVIFHSLENKSEHLEFKTKSGVLVARREGARISLDFPANPPRPLTPTEEKHFEHLVASAAGGLKIAEVQVSHATKKLLIRLHKSCTQFNIFFFREQLETLKADPISWKSLHDGSVVKGIILTLAGDLRGAAGEESTSGYHCLSRYFAPWNGIPEDPVTGSAHTVLGPFWAKKFGVSSLRCRQVSPRGGEVEVRVRDDGRVDLSGPSVIVLEGKLHI